MHLVHIGLVSTSEDHADRFFGELLGLRKTRTSQLPRDLAEGSDRNNAPFAQK